MDEGYTSVETRSSQRDKLESGLLFNRQPSGDTPYLNAVLWAEELIDSYKGSGRENIVFFVTDGAPADSSPNEVLRKARDGRLNRHH